MRTSRLLIQALVVVALGVLSAVRAPRADAVQLAASTACGQDLGCYDNCDAYLELDCSGCGNSFPVCEHDIAKCPISTPNHVYCGGTAS